MQSFLIYRFLQGELRGGDWSVDAINVFSDELLTRLEKLISPQLADLSAIITALGIIIYQIYFVPILF